MPDNSYFGDALVVAVKAGTVSQATIDTKVIRILTAMYALNLVAAGNSPLRNTSAPANPPEHATLTRELAEKSIVLLQNDGGLLPFSANSAKTVAVFGDTDTISGGGSGSVVRPYVVTAYQGISTYPKPSGSPSLATPPGSFGGGSRPSPTPALSRRRLRHRHRAERVTNGRSHRLAAAPNRHKGFTLRNRCCRGCNR